MVALAKSPIESLPRAGAAFDLKHPANSRTERTRRPTSLPPSTSQAMRWPTLSGIFFRTPSGMVTCHLEVIVDIALLILTHPTAIISALRKQYLLSMETPNLPG
jgi:hypothetical protein